MRIFRIDFRKWALKLMGFGDGCWVEMMGSGWMAWIKLGPIVTAGDLGPIPHM